MKKTFVVIEVGELERQRRAQAEGGAIAQARQDARVLLRGNNEQRQDNARHYDTQIVCFNTFPEAEEFVNDTILASPQLKFMICESIAYLESVPTTPIKKVWDANGQLR